MPEIESFVVHEALIEDNRANGLRSGEGAVASLGDDSLYMVYGQFEGGGDADRATLISRWSDDGLTWSDPITFRDTPGGALNVMSVSLLPLDDGSLAATYMRKQSANDCRPLFTTSDDEGRTWSEPVEMIHQAGYYTVNNDRVVQLSSGRLLVPFAYYDGSPGRGTNGCVFSDDHGRSWQMGEQIRIEKRKILKPKLMDARNLEAVKAIEEGDVHPQEPGVVELLDGRVLMWCRSPGGYAYRAVSRDGGETWGPYEAIPEFAMPCSPQSIKRIPGSERLIMLFNNRDGIPHGSSQFSWRRPLSIAVSDDDAVTWQLHGQLEPDTVPSNCYYSICFHGEHVIFTYYEGVMHTRRDGSFVPRNLASLKLKIVHRDYFAPSAAGAVRGAGQ